MKRLAAALVLLAFAAFLRGDEVRTGTGTTVGALPAGEVDPYPEPTQVPTLLCLGSLIAGGTPPYAYQLRIGNSVDVGPTYYHLIGLNAFALKPVVPDPATWTRGDPDTWIYQCMTTGGTVDRSSPPGGDTYGNVFCQFDCTDVGLFSLEVWATNSVGSDSCVVGNIEITDPNGLCGGP